MNSLTIRIGFLAGCILPALLAGCGGGGGAGGSSFTPPPGPIVLPGQLAVITSDGNDLTVRDSNGGFVTDIATFAAKTEETTVQNGPQQLVATLYYNDKAEGVITLSGPNYRQVSFTAINTLYQSQTVSLKAFTNPYGDTEVDALRPDGSKASFSNTVKGGYDIKQAYHSMFLSYFLNVFDSKDAVGQSLAKASANYMTSAEADFY